MIKSLVDTQHFNGMRVLARFSLLLAVTGPVMAGDVPLAVLQFVENNCVECHDTDTKKGGRDLTGLKFNPANSPTFSRWEFVIDPFANAKWRPRKKPLPKPRGLGALT